MSINNISSFDLRVLGKNISFKYPDNSYDLAISKNCLQGQEYPVAPIRDYSPLTIIDIGANIGASALFFMMHYPAAKIYCYEPDDYCFSFLQENTKYFNNIKIFPYGLYDRDGEYSLFKGKNSNAQNSIIKSPENVLENKKIKLANTIKELGNQNISGISILKIDTEGCEIPILYNIRSKIRDIELIYLEYHSEDDRLEIERLLSPYFILFNATTTYLHRGTNAYISKKLVSKYPNLEQLKISHK